MRIVRELLTGDRPQFQSKRERIGDVARRLGLHRNTVLRRILRIRFHRFLLPPVPFIDVTRLGFRGARAFFDLPVEARTQDRHERLFAIPGVLGLIDFAEGWEVAFIAPYGETIDGTAAKLEAVVGRRIDSFTIRSEDWPRGDDIDLDETDIRLVEALADDANASFRLLSKLTGLPMRTLQYRYHRLEKAQVLRMYPGGGSQPIGLLFLMILVEWKSARGAADDQQRILQRIPDHAARHLMPRKMWMLAFTRDMPLLHEQVAWIRGLAGVAAVRTFVFRGFDFNPAYHTWIAAQFRDRNRTFANAFPRSVTPSAPAERLPSES